MNTPGSLKWALYYIGGLLKTRLSSVRPVQSDHQFVQRLVPGYEAPVNLAYSSRNRSAAIRIPTYSECPKANGWNIAPRIPVPTRTSASAALLMGGPRRRSKQD